VIRLADHLIIAPVVLPLLAGAVMLALGGERRRNVNAALNVATTFALVAISIALLRAADAAASGVTGVYRLGDWPAPFAIVLVVDRLAALMLLLTSLLAAAAVVFSLARWHRVGVLFHPLFQFLLMGITVRSSPAICSICSFSSKSCLRLRMDWRCTAPDPPESWPGCITS